VYLRIRKTTDGDGEDRTSGIPKITAKDPAKEKLRTLVIDITVEAKQRLRAFRTVDIEAVSEVAGLGTARKRQGIAVRTTNKTGERA
jgi:hypothetical protein